MLFAAWLLLARVTPDSLLILVLAAVMHLFPFKFAVTLHKLWL